MPVRIPDLPPEFSGVILAQGDPFSRACVLAPAQGAGTIIWAPQDGRVDAAVVLYPSQSLATARLVLFAAMNAAADALAPFCRPDAAIRFGWPDTLLVDGRPVGSGRLGWPRGQGEANFPDWLVVGLKIDGVAGLDDCRFLGGFARALVPAIEELERNGPRSALRRWRGRFAGAGVVTKEGDFVGGRRYPLAEALAGPSWSRRL